MSDFRYTKGEPSEVIKRFDTIHSITLNCPICDNAMILMKRVFVVSLPNYMDNEDNNIFYQIPVRDVFTAITNTLTLCREEGIENTYKIILACGCVQSFKKLKYVSLVFTDSDKVKNSYDTLEKSINEHVDKETFEKEKVKLLNNIYTIDILEINLSNMFSQSVIDMYNKFMMSNGLMANSYLKRNFCTNFEFDGYTSFVEMFINNNLMFFEEIDANIIDYFSKFPDFISNQKPIIRILTNYSEL